MIIENTESLIWSLSFPVSSASKESACNVGSPGFNPLEEGLATHSSILAWRIPGTEDPGGLYGVAKSQTRQSNGALCSAQQCGITENHPATVPLVKCALSKAAGFYNA